MPDQEKESLKVIPREGVSLEVQVRNHRLTVDQPVEDGGKNAGIAPLEMFVGSLGACIGYFAVRFCLRHKIPHEGLEVAMEWDYAENPHRIGRITTDVKLPKGWNPEMNERFLKVIGGCTVHHSITVAPEITINLR